MLKRIAIALFGIIATVNLVAGQSEFQVRKSERQKARPPAGQDRTRTRHEPPSQQNQVEPTIVKLERGGKVAITNPFGDVVVTGWDGDTIEARATSDAGGESIKVEVQGTRVLLSTPIVRRGHGSSNMDVKVPRYAELSLVEVHHGDLQISGIDGSVTVSSVNGDVRISKVGPLRATATHGDVVLSDVRGDLFVRATSGDVSADTVSGAIDVRSNSGEVTIQNGGGAVSAHSLSGDVVVSCAKGNAETSTASGSISILGVGGDVSAETVSGEASFKGMMRKGGRYRLKSISGEVEMAIQSDPPGFTATLQSYNGEIETAFRLKIEGPVQGGPINRRIVGVFGDGQTEVKLDSFNGSVRLIKIVGAELKSCK